MTGVNVGRQIVGVAGTLLTLAGCTTTVTGSAQPAPRTTDAQPAITADPTPAPDVSDGTLVEAQRIAGATVLPEFIYPELTSNCFPTVPLIYPERMEGAIFAEGTATMTYTTYGFVAGWVTCRTTLEGDRNATVFVAEMSDRDSATVAAQELADTFVEVNGAEPTEIRGIENLPAVQTVSVEDGEETKDLYSGSYDLQGYLHLAIDPRIESELLPENGFQGMYLKSAEDEASGFSYQFQAYEFGSLAEADTVFAEFARIEQEEFTDRVMFQVPEDSTIPCFYTSGATPGAPIFQRCYTREGRFLGGTDVFGVTDPADITAIRGYVQQQIQLMRAP